MKISDSLLALAVLSLMPSAHAGLHLAWNAFQSGDANLAASNAPDYTSGTFLGALVPAGSTYLSSAGSLDQTYGNLAAFVPAPGVNNGRINLDSAQSIELWITNPSSSTYQFDKLYFDWANGGGGSTPRQVSTSFTNVANVTTPIGSASEATTTFLSVGQDLTALNFFVSPGSTVKFTFTNTGGDPAGRLDNIAVSAVFSAIPEVSSTLIFGGLLTSGLMIRRRPRQTVKI